MGDKVDDYNYWDLKGLPEDLDADGMSKYMEQAQMHWEKAASTIYLNRLDDWNAHRKAQWEKGDKKRQYKEKGKGDLDFTLSQLHTVMERTRTEQPYKHSNT